MYIITEKRDLDGLYYEKLYCNNDYELIEKKIIQSKTYETKLKDGTSIIMFYDSNMNPIESAIEFINFGGMENQSQNYLLIAKTALKLLHDYLEIYEINLAELNKSEAKGFLDFLKGISRKGLIYETHLKTHRRNQTINSYLKPIRLYVDYLGYEEHVFLLKQNSFKNFSNPNSDEVNNVTPYEIKVKTNNENEYVPAYISIEEYKKILNITKDTKTPLRDRVIIRLMFEHGLRIGEVLGITLEDIKFREKENFQVQYKIELRNRLSDSNEQNVKSAMNVISDDSYKEPEYTIKNIGYQTIILSESLGKELLDYINIAHSSINEKYISRKEMFSKADSVPYGNPDVSSNYYVFLNTLGRPLTENLWNKDLRKIFTKAGIPVDTNTRKNNLNHRFRHGYAMYLTNVLDVSPFDVKTLMRQKNLSSTAIYHKPTPEDIEKLQESLIEEWEISILNNGD